MSIGKNPQPPCPMCHAHFAHLPRIPASLSDEVLLANMLRVDPQLRTPLRPHKKYERYVEEE